MKSSPYVFHKGRLSCVKYCCTYLGVLFHELGEVVEERVLRPQEVELVVLLARHQVRQELPPVPRHELRRQLHHVPGNKPRNSALGAPKTSFSRDCSDNIPQVRPNPHWIRAHKFL